MHLRIGTRGSTLARRQTGQIAQALQALDPTLMVEEVIVATTGDGSDQPFDQLPGTGVFTSQLEAALRAGRIDLAVHSLKDLPTRLPDGLVLAAITEREDPRDTLVSPHGTRLDALPAGTRIGTASPRRQAQLRRGWPALVPVTLRGNVDSRLAKLEAGEVGGLLLAAAGLARIGRDVGAPQPLTDLLPAPAQGALGLEIRAGDDEVHQLVAGLDHGPTRQACTAERALLRRVEGGCKVPLGSFALLEDDQLHLRAEVLSADGTQHVAGERRGPAGAAVALGIALAEALLADGADRILAAIERD